jgi:hypothetical protein
MTGISLHMQWPPSSQSKSEYGLWTWGSQVILFMTKTDRYHLTKTSFVHLIPNVKCRVFLQTVTALKARFALLPGLPDGLFSNQKSKFGRILVGLAMENLGIFYNHLVYFTAIINILCTFGIFCVHLVNFTPFWYFAPRKIWQP